MDKQPWQKLISMLGLRIEFTVSSIPLSLEITDDDPLSASNLQIAQRFNHLWKIHEAISFEFSVKRAVFLYLQLRSEIFNFLTESDPRFFNFNVKYDT